MRTANLRFSGVQPGLNGSIIPDKARDSATILFFSTCCPFLTDGLKVNLNGTDPNIEGENDLNRVVNSNSEFLDKLAAIEKIDNCDQKVITINVLNAKVREVSIYVIISYL